MAQVSISKALNIKTKLAGRISHLGNLITSYNSYIEGAKQPFDVKELIKEYNDKSSKLAAVKAGIAKANADSGVFPFIYQMSELKSKIAHLRSLNTREGVEEYSGGYNQPNKTRTFVAVLSAKEIEDLVVAAETEIEKAQDQITYLNQSTKIEVAD